MVGHLLYHHQSFVILSLEPNEMSYQGSLSLFLNIVARIVASTISHVVTSFTVVL